MFDISGLEMVVLVVLAILLFGPDKLPKLASDAVRIIRQFREFTQSARADISRELGPEFSDLRLDDLNPRTFVRKNLLANGSLLDDVRLDLDLDAVPLPRSPRPVQERVQPGERPPYDPDAT